MHKILTLIILTLLLVTTASANQNDCELVQINSTHWFFVTIQTDLEYGEYNYQAFANNISTDYRVLTYSSAVGAPAIIDWNNSKTNNNSLEITIDTDESVNFNATANQTITTWNWYKDTVNQSHNFDNITLSWTASGSKTVITNATNANGTSNSVQWNVTVEAVEEFIGEQIEFIFI